MLETQKQFNTMVRAEEVRPEMTGLAHDHLMASSRMQSAHANTLHHHHHTSQPQGQQAQAQPLSQSAQNVPPAPLGCLSSIQDKTNILQQQQQQQQRPAENDLCGSQELLKRGDNHHGASALSTIAILRRQTMYDSLVLVKRFRPCLNGYTLEFPTSNLDENDAGGVVVEKSPRSCSENQAAGECAKLDADPGCGRTKLVSVYLDGDDPMYQSRRAVAAQARATSGDGGPSDKPDDGDVVYVPVNGLLERLDNYDRHGVSIDSRVYAFAMGLKTAERFLTSSAEKEIQEAPPL